MIPNTNQNIERDKSVAELLGECWHDVTLHGETYFCRNCLEYDPEFTNFSTWDGFGKIIAFLDNEWCDTEIAATLYTLVEKHGPQNLPDSLADYLYTIIKALES